MKKFDLEAIRARRLALGLTTQEMADRMGFSGHSVYWKYEHGSYRLNADMLPRLAKALHCSIGSFFTKSSAESERHKKRGQEGDVGWTTPR